MKLYLEKSKCTYDESQNGMVILGSFEKIEL